MGIPGEFFKELNLSEGRATGIPTIQNELVRNGSEKASFETNDDRSYFLITIPCHPDFIGDEIDPTKQIKYPIHTECLDRSPEACSTINGTIPPRELTERQQTLLQLLIADQGSMQAVIAEALGISITTLRRELATLMDLGLVKRIASKKTGRWIVIHPSTRANGEQ